MQTPRGLLVVGLCASLVAVSCQQTARDGGQGAADTSDAQTGQQALERWGPVRVPCDALGEYALTSSGSDTVVVELGLDPEGQLTASPPTVVVATDQALQWRSDTLRWRVTLVGNLSPFPPMKGDISGGTDGTAMPEGDRAAIRDECGRYYYVASAVHPETGAPLLLDPPIVVRDRE